jgi:CheY-like chemotaxis protein
LNVPLVEDDADARALYGYMLALASYKVKAVSNGLEAFAEIQVNRPDVIVTDTAMPVLERIAVACTVWGDLFNRPVCGFVHSGKKREAKNSRHNFHI